MKAPRHVNHGEVAIGMLKADPDFAHEYLATALEEADFPGGSLRYWLRFAILLRPKA